MNRDLFLALLSMDSYNRGYGQNVTGLPNLGSIGNATIVDIALPAGSVAAGFYAIAYDWNGEKVIAYRGSASWHQLRHPGPDPGSSVLACSALACAA
jgi:hypothetical protein